MTDIGRWSVGDPIILREVYQGRVWAIRPVTVVEDAADRIALYLAPGTMWKRPVSASGEPLRLQASEWELADLQWAGNAALWLTPPGAAHSVILWWEPASWRLEGWYVNLEQPFRRTTLGFDYLDQVLDIVVAPDRSSWFWKDEDEFATAQQLGVLTRAEATAIRTEGERVIAAIESNGPPFCDGWEVWRPDPGWTVPGMPEGWDEVGG
jgi:predicted RNA-binding protein associated with RNAse of E/G family